MKQRFDHNQEVVSADNGEAEHATPAVQLQPGRNSSMAAIAERARAQRPDASNVQLYGGGTEAIGAEAGDIAGEGTAGTGHALPNLNTIQKSFGKHDVSGVRAHTDAPAVQATEDMGAPAFATGRDVVLGNTTDLHTVAHEAAHVVQQRGGVQLKGGVSEADDQYEQHADAVADKVVSGESAEGLLDQHADSSQTEPGTTGVQALFGTVRANLIANSRTRGSNASYNQILVLLNQAAALQVVAPTVAQCDQMLALIAQVQGLMQNAASTKWFKKGRDRNAALTAMGLSLANEAGHVRTARDAAQLQATINLNTDGPGYAGALPGLGTQAPNLSNTGGQQGASGSYFDRGPNVGVNPGPIRGIFKPESQEGGARAGQAKRGEGAVREVLGDHLDQSLGLGVVPRTRMIAMDSPTLAQGAHQNIPGSGDSLQVGSYQEGVANVGGDLTHYLGNANAAHRNFDADSLQKIAILDMISLNKDRHGENVMFDNANNMKAIDQGEMAPTAMGYNTKFRGQTAASGFAWADIPEAEQAWTLANQQIIANMDPVAEVDALAQRATLESTNMSAITGQDAQDTHLSAQSIAMMKYGARTLKICAQAGLSPAQIETIYTKRGQARAARNDVTGAHVQKTAKLAGGGEFADFINATFFQDDMNAQIAAATGQPVPPAAFTYGCPECEDAWNVAIATGLNRVAQQDATKRAGVNQVLGITMLPQMVGAPNIPLTHASTTAQAGRLWTHMRTPATAVGTAGLDEKVVMAQIWESGNQATRTRILQVLDVTGDQLRMSHLGYILEAVDPTHRMNLPSKLVTWYQTANNTDFWAWLAVPVNNVAPGGPRADYRNAMRRADVQVAVNGGRLQQGNVPADMDTTADAQGWTVVLSGGEFYSQPKSGHADVVKTQHSSFMAGLPVDGAAMMKVNAGTLTFMNNYSGHYTPSIPNMVKMILTMQGKGVNMTDVDIKDDRGLVLALTRPGQFKAMEYIGLSRNHMR